MAHPTQMLGQWRTFMTHHRYHTHHSDHTRHTGISATACAPGLGAPGRPMRARSPGDYRVPCLAGWRRSFMNERVDETGAIRGKTGAARGAAVAQMRALMAAMAAALFVTPADATFDSGSTGADGSLNVTVNTEIVLPPSGVLNYTSINIPAGVPVTFRKNVTNTPLYLLASGSVTIAGPISIQGAHGRATGTYGDGALGDDGIPGVGGPGGHDGGRGGRQDAASTAEIIRAGPGLGPGGGLGGKEGGNGCSSSGYYPGEGTGGAYAVAAYQAYAKYLCAAATLTKFSRPYGSAFLQPLLGGSGGGGGNGGVTYPGSGGGGGGGAILIASSATLQMTGTIDARGGDAGGNAGTGVGGSGAGGSGGAIRLVATSIAGNGSLLAEGGCRSGRREYCGSDGTSGQYGGSAGRIRLEADAITFSGTSRPAYAADRPRPVFIAQAPSLRISSIAGQAVPEHPTGHADVSLPASTTGPVEVVFATTNVPVGNTIQLRIAPAYGAVIEALSPAIGGTAAAGTAQGRGTLPAGAGPLPGTTRHTPGGASRGAGNGMRCVMGGCVRQGSKAERSSGNAVQTCDADPLSIVRT